MSNDVQTKKGIPVQIIPVMLCFFAMGFVDLVGTASSYVMKEHELSNTVANILPSMVFVWFLIFSIPTSLLMNRIGRKNTVMLSMVVTVISLLLPIFSNSLALMLVAFSLLGIGNAIMQTSLNPLITNLISGKTLASAMTFGQFVKAIASFMAPLIMGWCAAATPSLFGLGWRALFPIYGAVAVIASVLLAIAAIPREQVAGETSSFADCFKLLGVGFVLFSFIGIICHVGVDVGINTTAPRLLMERAGLPLEAAGFATSLYFICRTAGCLLGALLLSVVSHRKVFFVSVLMLLLAMVGMFFGDSKTLLYGAIVLAGLGNSNIFSVIFAQSLQAVPDKQNEVSGLLIMGIIGGAIFPPIMGVAADAVNSQAGAIAVMTLGVLFLLFYTVKMRK